MKKFNNLMKEPRGNWNLSSAMMVVVLILLVAAAGTMVRAAVPQNEDGNSQGRSQNSNGNRAEDWDDNDQDHPREQYTIGLWGDMPYSAVQADAVLDLINDMNSQGLAFTVHDGDLKAGKGTPD